MSIPGIDWEEEKEPRQEVPQETPEESIGKLLKWLKAWWVLLFALSACSELTPKQWTYTVAGVLVVGAITAHELSNGNHHRCPQNNCGTLVQIPYP